MRSISFNYFVLADFCLQLRYLLSERAIIAFRKFSRLSTQNVSRGGCFLSNISWKKYFSNSRYP
jgi:hypothetical protein